MRTIKGTHTIDQYKAIRSLDDLCISETIRTTIEIQVKCGDWHHGKAVRSFVDGGRSCVEWQDGVTFHYTEAGAWY